MRVLLTGAAGFVGRECLTLLSEAGVDVCAVSSRPRTPSRGVTWRQADLLDAAQVRALVADVRPSHLLHLAWITKAPEYWTSPDNLRWSAASLELLHAFRAQGGRRAVLAGTCAEYDWQFGRCVEDETPTAPGTLYGVTKLATSQIARAFAAGHDLSLAWGRIFFTFGPFEPRVRLLPSVITSLLAGQPARCSAGTQARDFLFVRDVARGFVDTLRSEATGAINIASGEAITVRDLVLQAADVLDGRDLVVFGAPTKEPPLVVADTTRLRQEVGWTPRLTLREAIAETVDWWRSREANPAAGEPA